MDSEELKLDKIFKKYLQILKPHLLHLIDQDVIDICNAWIRKLSDCKKSEKVIRNKYIFALCFQIAKGILDEPFLKYPTNDNLQDIPEEIHSDDSEVDFVIDSQETIHTTVLYNNKKAPDDILSEITNIDENIVLPQSTNFNTSISNCKNFADYEQFIDSKLTSTSQCDKNAYCFSSPKTLKKCNDTALDVNYEGRALNLIMKLREIKKQNILLQNELVELKELPNKSFNDDESENSCRIRSKHSICTACTQKSHFKEAGKTTTLNCKLRDVRHSREKLLEKITDLQEELHNVHEKKQQEIDEIRMKHSLQLISIKNSARDEIAAIYEKKLDDLKSLYENSIKDIEKNKTFEINTVKEMQNTNLIDKDSLLRAKDEEIMDLKKQLNTQKLQLNSLLNKLIDKPEDSDVEKTKILQLEKQLTKMEKSRNKLIKSYETKLSSLQREKHLAECALQLQLVRQRAQVVNEVTDENQAELATALDKLETRYKEIVANVQATAIQRRIQDQSVLENILQACGLGEAAHECPITLKATPNRNREANRSFDNEVSALMHGRKVGNVIVGNKSFGEDKVTVGYCLDGGRLGELFEKVHIPQRDVGDGQK